jgi:hypothetical protein
LLSTAYNDLSWLFFQGHGITSHARASSSLAKNIILTQDIIYIPKAPFLQADDLVRESLGQDVFSSNDEAKNPLLSSHCHVTTQYRLLIDHAQDQDGEDWSLWTLHSLFGPDSKPKKQGGDEIYVEWRRADSNNNDDVLVALVQDQGDGSYSLEFVIPPLLVAANAASSNKGPSESLSTSFSAATTATTTTKGTLNIYLDYSCGLGDVMPPGKDDWNRAGEIQTIFVKGGIQRPRARPFQPPNSEYDLDLSKYDVVISFGDSIMLQFARRYKTPKFFHKHLFWSQNTNQPLSSPEEADAMVAKLKEWHGPQIADAAAQNQTVAAVTGTALWDILRGRIRPGLREHVAAIRRFLVKSQQTFPNVHFYWKSPSAIHLHRSRRIKDLELKDWRDRR